MKVYVAMHLCQGEWVPLGEIPHAFSCEESAWKALKIAFKENDAFKQAVVSIDEEQYRAGLDSWLNKC